MTFAAGLVLGLFAGTAIGVFLTCIMVASRRVPTDGEAQRHQVAGFLAGEPRAHV